MRTPSSPIPARVRTTRIRQPRRTPPATATARRRENRAGTHPSQDRRTGGRPGPPRPSHRGHGHAPVGALSQTSHQRSGHPGRLAPHDQRGARADGSPALKSAPCHGAVAHAPARTIIFPGLSPRSVPPRTPTPCSRTPPPLSPAVPALRTECAGPRSRPGAIARHGSRGRGDFKAEGLAYHVDDVAQGHGGEVRELYWATAPTQAPTSRFTFSADPRCPRSGRLAVAARTVLPLSRRRPPLRG